MEENTQFRKNFIWNMIGTTFNAFNSLFFMIIVTRVNGTNDAGIFTLAFSTACILYIVGIYAGRIYQVTEADKKITDKDYIVSRVTSCLVMIILGIAFTIIKKYDFYKSIIFIILIVYKAIESFSDVFYGILQKNNMLDKVGKSCFYKALASLLIFFIVDFTTKDLLFSCSTIVLVFLLGTILYDFRNTQKLINKEENLNFESVISIFKDGFFAFAITFLGLYMTNAPKYAIDNFLTEDIQAIFGIIIMPATVMGLFAQFLIHPYLNEIFEAYKMNQYDKIKKILYKIIFIILLCGIVCSILGYLIGTQVLGFIYGINLLAYREVLFIILIGATLYTMAGVISPILTTMRHTKIQFAIYGIISVIEFLLCNILAQKLEMAGATISYFVTMFIYFIIFYIVSMKVINIKRKETRK